MIARFAKILALALALSAPLSAQTATEAVIKNKSTKALTDSIVIPSGKSITINSGATITNNGTATGFGGGGTWGSITGTLSSQTDLASALAAKQPLDSDLTEIAALTTTSFGRAILTETDADTLKATLGLFATLSGGFTITGVGGATLDIGSGGTLGTAAFANYGTDEYQLLRWAANFNTDPVTQAIGATELGAIKRVNALPIAAGGTNAETASAALNNLLPDQFDQANKLLMSDGTNASWVLPDIASQTDGLLSADRLSGGTVGADRKITFGASITSAGINIGASVDEPETMTDGDMYYDSTSHYVGARVNGVTRRLFDSGNTIGLANGGTGRTSATAYAVVCGGTTGSSALQSVASVGTSGQVLTSNGAGALPTFQSPASGLTIGTTTTSGASANDLLISNGTVVQKITPGTGVATFLATPTASNFNALFGSSNYGIDTNGTTYSSIKANGAAVAGGNVSFANFGVINSWALGFTPNVVTNGVTAFFMYDATATIQMGSDAASVVAQTLKAHDALGTDKAGASFTLAGGQSTGTGRGGDVITKTSLSGSTGSTANSYSTRSFASAKPVDLTESTATTCASVAIASGKIAGVRLVCTVYANDGTDYQSISSDVRVDAVNKAGTVTATISQTDNTTAASAGTLSVTYTAAANGNAVDIKANAVSSLTQTVLRCKWQIVAINSDDVGTITAQ